MQPSTGLFGAPAAGRPLFGVPTTAPATGAPAAAPGAGLFSAPAPSAPAAGAAVPSLFTGGSFGAPSTGAPPAGGFFGAPRPAAPAATQPSAVPGAGIFTPPAKTEATASLFSAAAAAPLPGKSQEETKKTQPQGLFGMAPIAVPTTAPSLLSPQPQPRPEEKKTAMAPAQAPAAATGGLGMFGAQPPATTKSAAPAPLAGAVPAAPGGGLFGAPGAAAAPTAPAPAAGRLFGARPEEKKAEAKEEKKLPEYSPLQTLEEMEKQKLNTVTLDEICSKWRTSLTGMGADFHKTAEEIKRKELGLFEITEQIRGIAQQTEAVAEEARKHKEQLETVSKQQEHLNKCLDSLLNDLDPYLDRSAATELTSAEDPMFDRRANYLGTREQIFQRARGINEQLNGLEGSLNEITNAVNDTEKAAGGSKEMAGVEQLLNTYYDALRWVDVSAKETKTQLENIEATYGVPKY